MIDHPPDTRRPGPACHSENQANIRNTRSKFTSSSPVCATLLDVAMGAVLGVLLAMLAVRWLDWSLAGATCQDRMVQVEVTDAR